jgi:PleD family two-component response regulator
VACVGPIDGYRPYSVKPGPGHPSADKRVCLVADRAAAGATTTEADVNGSSSSFIDASALDQDVGGSPGRAARILVIDDDVDVRAMLDLTFQRAGFEVYGRAHGVGALAAALSLRPGVVILDWVLPTYSGLEVCSAIRSRRELDDTKVIMISSRRRDADVELGYIAGADRYLVKPIVPRVLMRHVCDLLPN